MKGIDISSWQKGLDLAVAKPEFVICKISEGRSWVDPCFDTFYSAAKCPVGAYVFSRATTTAAATEEARKAISLLRGRDLPLGVYMDVEDSSQLALPNDQLTAVIGAFCSTIRAEGYRVGIYGSAGNLWAKVSPNAFGDAFIWVAQWSSQQPKIPCDIWQYTDHARCDGYGGNIDGDEALSSRFIALVNGSEQADPATPDPDPTDDGEIRIKMPTLKCGDGKRNGKQRHVKIMQTALIGLGCSCGWMGADGEFGEQTKIGLYKFQQKNGMATDCVCKNADWIKLLEG